MGNTKIRIVSDLHIEWLRGEYRLSDSVDETGTVLILAGDICEFDKLSLSEDSQPNQYHQFFIDISNRFRKVLYVPGNHEYYRGHLPNSTDKFNRMCQLYKIDNIHLMNPDTIQIDQVYFIGATLWTDYGRDPMVKFDAGAMMNDYRAIRTQAYRKLTTNDVLGLHFQHKNHIFSELKRLKGEKVVVITHHGPTTLSISEKYSGDRLNFAYTNKFDNDLLDMSDEGIAPEYWIHGHTHTSMAYTVGTCSIICNPMGYTSKLYGNENLSFNDRLTISI